MYKKNTKLLKLIMNLSDVAEAEERSASEFTDHADSSGRSASVSNVSQCFAKHNHMVHIKKKNNRFCFVHTKEL